MTRPRGQQWKQSSQKHQPVLSVNLNLETVTWVDRLDEAASLLENILWKKKAFIHIYRL